MTTQSINVARLGHAIGRKRRHENLSMDDVTNVIPGISKSTISRIERGLGMTPDTDNLVVLTRWLGAPIDAFLVDNDNKVVHFPDASTLDKIVATLDADTSLDDLGRDALIDLMRSALIHAQEATHV